MDSTNTSPPRLDEEEEEERVEEEPFEENQENDPAESVFSTVSRTTTRPPTTTMSMQWWWDMDSDDDEDEDEEDQEDDDQVVVEPRHARAAIRALFVTDDDEPPPSEHHPPENDDDKDDDEEDEEKVDQWLVLEQDDWLCLVLGAVWSWLTWMVRPTARRTTRRSSATVHTTAETTRDTENQHHYQPQQEDQQDENEEDGEPFLEPWLLLHMVGQTATNQPPPPQHSPAWHASVSTTTASTTTTIVPTTWTRPQPQQRMPHATESLEQQQEEEDDDLERHGTVIFLLFGSTLALFTIATMFLVSGSSSVVWCWYSGTTTPTRSTSYCQSSSSPPSFHRHDAGMTHTNTRHVVIGLSSSHYHSRLLPLVLPNHQTMPDEAIEEEQHKDQDGNHPPQPPQPQRADQKTRDRKATTTTRTTARQPPVGSQPQADAAATISRTTTTATMNRVPANPVEDDPWTQGRGRRRRSLWHRWTLGVERRRRPTPPTPTVDPSETNKRDSNSYLLTPHDVWTAAFGWSVTTTTTTSRKALWKPKTFHATAGVPHVPSSTNKQDTTTSVNRMTVAAIDPGKSTIETTHPTHEEHELDAPSPKDDKAITTTTTKNMSHVGSTTWMTALVWSAAAAVAIWDDTNNNNNKQQHRTVNDGDLTRPPESSSSSISTPSLSFVSQPHSPLVLLRQYVPTKIQMIHYLSLIWPYWVSFIALLLILFSSPIAAPMLSLYWTTTNGIPGRFHHDNHQDYHQDNGLNQNHELHQQQSSPHSEDTMSTAMAAPIDPSSPSSWACWSLFCSLLLCALTFQLQGHDDDEDNNNNDDNNEDENQGEDGTPNRRAFYYTNNLFHQLFHHGFDTERSGRRTRRGVRILGKAQIEHSLEPSTYRLTARPPYPQSTNIKDSSKEPLLLAENGTNDLGSATRDVASPLPEHGREHVSEQKQDASENDNETDHPTSHLLWLGPIAEASSSNKSTLSIPLHHGNDNAVRTRPRFISAEDTSSCCAICLSPYQDGDIISGSSFPHCIHLFHRDCIVAWLVRDSSSHSSTTPQDLFDGENTAGLEHIQEQRRDCPCCRQTFLGDDRVTKTTMAET